LRLHFCACFRRLLILAAHAKLDVVLLTGLDVGIIPCDANDECEDHWKEVVDIQGPLVRQQIALLCFY
jgi:hypothetical protein